MRLTSVTFFLTLLLIQAPLLSQSTQSGGSSSISPPRNLDDRDARDRSVGDVILPRRYSDPVNTVEEVVKRLNQHNTVLGTEDSKSYRIIFDAYLDLSKPPFPIGEGFSQSTIHAKMKDWARVSSWAESNQHMVKAILQAQNKNIVGLPYGRENVDSVYRDSNIFVDIGVDGQLRNIDFNYFEALETISAFATAEIYRHMEAKRVDEALDLAMAHIYVLRQFCDRDFLKEKNRSIKMLSMAMANLRDVFYVYLDQIDNEQFRNIAVLELPFLRPDRNRLLMPEADRVVSEARIRDVFEESTGQAMPDRFTAAFAGIQAENKPLMRFGAARRWEIVALIHGSLDSSLNRLKLIYDDWWRRWRVQAFDPILDVPTQFSRCNPIRYAAVLYTMEDIGSIYGIRNQLIAEINGTAMAAGLCGYMSKFKTYPRDQSMVYAVSVRKRTDLDPHDLEFSTFKYRRANSRQSIDTAWGRIWVEAGGGILYSRGQDHRDDRAETHVEDGESGDVVLWPPIKAVLREQGLLD